MVDLEHPILLNEFSKIGINPEAVAALPDDVRRALRNELPTPIIIVSYNANGDIIKLPVRLQTSTSVNGAPMLTVYGLRKELNNIYSLSPAEFESIKKGDIVVLRPGDKTIYLQADPLTNNIISLPEHKLKLADRLKSVEKILDFELGSEQKQRIMEGKPVTLDIGGEKSTLGVDLKEPNAFKILKGDMHEWQRQKEIEYDIAHPEFLGLVQTEQNRWEYMMIQKKGLSLGGDAIKANSEQVKHGGMKI